MKTILYKLTDKDGYCRRGTINETQYEVGKTYNATGDRPELCTDGLLHAYENPLLAVFMDPIHAGYGATARMFRCETTCELVRDGQLKCGVRELTIVEEIPLPQVTPEQRVRFAIFCAAAAQGIEL